MTRRHPIKFLRLFGVFVTLLACSRSVWGSPALSIQWNPPSTGSGRGAINLTLVSSSGTYTKTIRYGEFSTAYSLAAAVGGVLSQDPACPVWAKGNSDGTVSMVARLGAISTFSASLNADNGSAPSGLQVNADAGGIGASTTMPHISGLSVTTAQMGQSVTISGSNFGASSSTTVTVGGIAVNITSFSSSSITFVVPPGLATGSVVVTDGASHASNGVILVITAPAPCVNVPSFPN